MSNKKIMIVEENLFNAADIADTLVGSGYDVVGIVSSGENAVSMAKHVHLDLILMDIMVNRAQDGVTTAAEILSQTDLPIIYMSQYADEALVNRAKDILPYGFLKMPADEKTLLATIKGALSRHTWDLKSGGNEWQCGATYPEDSYPKGKNKNSSWIKCKKSGTPLKKAEWMAN